MIDLKNLPEEKGIHMHAKMFLARSIVMVLSIVANDAYASVEFPKALQGVWDLGPEPCRSPVNPDADSPIEIKARVLQAYEHTEKPIYVRRASSKIKAWVISTDADIAPGIVVYDLYVLSGDHLTITDGETTRQYLRCR